MGGRGAHGPASLAHSGTKKTPWLEQGGKQELTPEVVLWPLSTDINTCVHLHKQHRRYSKYRRLLVLTSGGKHCRWGGGQSFSAGVLAPLLVSPVTSSVSFWNKESFEFFFELIFYIYFVYVEIILRSEQLEGVDSPVCDFGDWTQVIRLGGEQLYLLTDLQAGPVLPFK